MERSEIIPVQKMRRNSLQITCENLSRWVSPDRIHKNFRIGTRTMKKTTTVTHFSINIAIMSGLVLEIRKTESALNLSRFYPYPTVKNSQSPLINRNRSLNQQRLPTVRVFTQTTQPFHSKTLKPEQQIKQRGVFDVTKQLDRAGTPGTHNGRLTKPGRVA
jgi:hypothetical protein